MTKKWLSLYIFKISTDKDIINISKILSIGNVKWQRVSEETSKVAMEFSQAQD